MHGHHLALEKVVLLASIMCILRIVAKTTEFGNHLLFVLLAAADVVDGWYAPCVSLSLRFAEDREELRTFCQDFPFTRFRPSISRDRFVELLEKVLHLASTLTLGEFVTHTQLGSPAVVANGLG